MHIVISKGFTFRDKNKVKWVHRYRDGESIIQNIVEITILYNSNVIKCETWRTRNKRVG